MSHFFALSIALIFANAALTQEPKAEKAALPADLAAVPNDSLGFVHVKLASLWKNEALKDVRTILEKAGAKAIEAFDNRFTPAPSSIDRVTAYMPAPDFANQPQFDFVIILAVNKPYDRDKFLKQLNKPRLYKGRIGGFYADEEQSIAVRFINDQTIAFGSVQALEHMVNNAPPQKPGPLTSALEFAAVKSEISAGFNVTAVPAELVQETLQRYVPQQLFPIFNAESMMLALDLEGDGHIHAKISYADEKTADAAEHALGVAIEMAKKLIADTRKELTDKVLGDDKPTRLEDFPEAAASLLGLGALQHIEELLKTEPVKRVDNSLSATLALPPQLKSVIGAAGFAAAMVAPAVGRIREAANRLTSANNLKQIALALHNYEAANNALPAASVVDKKGKPMLSWRVMILPYLEQEELYKQFHFDEPWDSDHNKKLIDKMPKVFSMPKNMSKPGQTHYRVFVGKGALWDWVTGTTFAQITDGLSNTILAVEAEEGVPWTKPDEFEFDPKAALPKFGRFFKGGFNAAFADGSVRFIRHTLDEMTMKAMITMAGGEVFRLND